MLQKFEIQNM